jgi:hypothetical protein
MEHVYDLPKIQDRCVLVWIAAALAPVIVLQLIAGLLG